MSHRSNHHRAKRAALAAPALAAALAFAPASHHAPAVRHGHVRVATGIQLHYVVQGDPAGAPVILLHGLSDTWYSFSGILPLLSPRLRVYALDLRGHGDSQIAASGYGMDDLAADVLAFMDAKGIHRATVVGHSMGSLVAQRLAVAAPARVERLVLVGSATTGRTMNDPDAFQQAVNALPDPVPLEFTREFQKSTIHAPVADAFVERVSADSRRLPAHAWRGLVQEMFDAEPPAPLRASRVPTLVVWGDHDAVFPRSEQDALVALIGASATLTVYAETGHAVHWERPAEFVRDLESFVK